MRSSETHKRSKPLFSHFTNNAGLVGCFLWLVKKTESHILVRLLRLLLCFNLGWGCGGGLGVCRRGRPLFTMAYGTVVNCQLTLGRLKPAGFWKLRTAALNFPGLLDCGSAFCLSHCLGGLWGQVNADGVHIPKSLLERWKWRLTARCFVMTTTNTLLHSRFNCLFGLSIFKP